MKLGILAVWAWLCIGGGGLAMASLPNSLAAKQAHQRTFKQALHGAEIGSVESRTGESPQVRPNDSLCWRVALQRYRGIFVASLSQREADPSMMPASSMGWLQGGVRQPVNSNTLDPSLPVPLSKATAPSVEWPLVVLQGFSGMIVAGVSSYLLQTLVDLSIVGPVLSERSATDFQTAGIVGTLVTSAVIPWIIGGTVYALGRLSNNYRSSFWWALLGAYLGEGVAMGVGLLLNAIDQSEGRSTSRLIRFLLDGLLVGVGSVLFYTLFRYPLGNVQQIGSLLQYNHGSWAWGLPLPRLSSVSNNTTVSIPVLSGRF